MSKVKKAEQRALEAYPVKEDWVGNQYGSYGDVNERFRGIYQEGYHQAEKDLELTWEDIEKIDDITLRFDASAESRGMSNQEFYQEVLKRFSKERR